MPYTSCNLIVVDDDPTVCSVVCRMLSRILPGSTIHACHSAAEALVMAQDIPVDCIITDYKLGDGDGITLTRSLHTLYPRLPVVLISGLLASTLQDDATKAGCVAVLSKPIAFALLRDTVLPLLSPLLASTAKA